MLSIKVNRDSVCMGDDVEDHQISINLTENMTFEELFHELIKNKYLPQIHGNDIVWVLTYKDNDLFTYVTKPNKIYSCFIDSAPRVATTVDPTFSIIFKYFSSQNKRAEYLFKKYEGKKFHIWHEGYMNEYKSYNISKSQEQKWLSDLA